MTETKIVIQLSDLHVTGEGELYGKIDSLQSVVTILGRIEETRKCDVLVLTGDLADRGEARAYQRLRSVVDDFSSRMGVAVMYLPGNHDERRAFRSNVLDLEGDDAKSDQVLWIDGLRIIGLDSTADDGHHGELDDSQLDWLDRQLAETAPLGTILALHHPPIPGPIEAINLLCLREPERLAKVVAGRDVKMILAGHTHHVSAGQLAGVPVWVATATAYQVDVPASDLGIFRGIAGSGYSRIDVDSSGAYATHLSVSHTGEHLYEMDLEVMRRHIAGEGSGDLESAMAHSDARES
jgi:Icc protein